MDELAKAGANHPKIEEENKCKKEEDTNTGSGPAHEDKYCSGGPAREDTKGVPKETANQKNTRGIDSGSAVQRTTKKKGST